MSARPTWETVGKLGKVLSFSAIASKLGGVGLDGKALLALRERIRQKTRRTRGDSLACIIADLNPTLRGWFHYFKHAQPWVHQLTDGFVRRRLRAILRKQDKRPGMGKCRDDHLRWPNAFFAAQGLFTLTTARVLASQSR